MMVNIKAKAFLFDFDGVICDSEKAHFLSTLKTIQDKEMGLTEEYYFEKLFGFDDKALFDHVYQMHGKKLDKNTLKKLMIEKNEEFMKLVETQIIYFDGVVDLIKGLHQKNIPLAVVSGALSHEVEVCLKKGDLDKYFEFMICADNVKRSKPHPESYETAFSKMAEMVDNLELNECWVLEDSPTGIESAKSAGLPVIGITNSVIEEFLKDSDHIVSHYKDINII